MVETICWREDDWKVSDMDLAGGPGTVAEPQAWVRCILMTSKEESQSSHKECLLTFRVKSKITFAKDCFLKS